jgi:hypothetical protein
MHPLKNLLRTIPHCLQKTHLLSNITGLLPIPLEKLAAPDK